METIFWIYIFIVLLEERIDPSTFCLQGKRSTTELFEHFIIDTNFLN